MNTIYSGSVEHNGYKYNYQPVNPENPVQGIKLESTVYYSSVAPHSKTLPTRSCIKSEVVIKINKPKDVPANCFCAAAKIYSGLKHIKLMPPIAFNGNHFSSFLAEEGNFICNEIIAKRYIAQLSSSPYFKVVVNPINGDTEAFWNTNRQSQSRKATNLNPA